ncbi:PspA/IM30 family protein [Jatrophihabitans lederbergiae]|uniref:PspA/IM30 family protein n=1 Tax=Jatrophihabitans lederbergiae TaxID=3075547 RepID=A0ABU2J800_9ACTN|nr:PspA/IM30 family protein [Jatrophihabitans sp. DSM 44399]MDT0261108.1 PspA/IM30 family protein [Jatrophihabitans sp. DSM 44399]
MANGFAKAWNYVAAWFGAKVDEKADPKIQIQQAIQDAQRQHARLSQQAAAVIGNQHQLELKLDRQLAQIEDLQAQARQALVLADRARAGGDEAKAAEFEQTAGVLANQLVTAESSAADLKQLHDQSMGAAQQARQAVQDNSMLLQEKLSERTKLLSQLEQAKMQEQVSASLNSMSELAAPSNTPSLEDVRDKIERRYANALGQADLATNSVQGRMLEVKKATTNMAGQARLEEIRASLAGGSASGNAGAVQAESQPAIENHGTAPGQSQSAAQRAETQD